MEHYKTWSNGLVSGLILADDQFSMVWVCMVMFQGTTKTRRGREEREEREEEIEEGRGRKGGNKGDRGGRLIDDDRHQKGGHEHLPAAKQMREPS